ncbi:amidase family protein [Salinibacillus aidingensis]|uniref:Amidase family protein n=1 Tax=Salinibacillus aidingensis TaxID=237684 RepID=A0ABP3KW27_9BACI
MFHYEDYDGLGLAKLVQKKEVKPEELTEEAIKRIEQHNPQLNAVIHKMYDQAKKQSQQPVTGTFAGVPMLLKNITQEIEGEPITAGSKAFNNYRAKQDSNFVKKLRETGVSFLGQTNVPEFALMGITEPKHYGPTRNPWNPDYTPGGSSGGSAAAVASGMVPIAGANDGGGSIRIPSAYTGLFGLKPSRGRTPVGPNVGRNWQGASVDHVLSKTVRDSAAMLDELRVYEKAGAFHAPPFDGSYLDIVQALESRPLKIAYSTQSPIGTEVEQDCIEAVEKTARLLEDMGHIVEEKEPGVNGRALAKSYFTMYFGEVSATLHDLQDVLGRKAKPSDVEPETWLLGMLGKAGSIEDYVLSMREWDQAAIKMESFHEEYDLYMTPTTAFKPARIGELDTKPSEKRLIRIASSLHLGKVLKKVRIIDQIMEDSLKRTPFTQLANLTGQPAMSIPLHKTDHNLPLGVQFIAARGREDLLLELAGQLEQTEHWLKVNKQQEKSAAKHSYSV